MMESDKPAAADKITIGCKKNVAFACSGGGVKAGAFHLGVALALQEQGFRFLGGLRTEGSAPVTQPLEIGTYVGSSAGSIICSYLAAGYQLQDIFNSFLGHEPSETTKNSGRVLPRMTYPIMLKLRSELAKEQLLNLFSLRGVVTELLRGNWESLIESRWLKTTGLFTTAGLEQHLREDVLPSNLFQDYAADLYIVATQLNHPRKAVFGARMHKPPPSDPSVEYFTNVPISHACAASGSLPILYAPYALEIPGRGIVHCIDGEIRDTLSTHVAVDAGSDLVIASYTHQPYHFSAEVGSLTDLGLPAILVQSIYLVIEHKINSYVQNKIEKQNALDAVSKYCRDAGLDDSHRANICNLLEAKLNHRRGVDTIYIHPNPRDHKVFTMEHFSLNPKVLTAIVRSGFKAGMDVLSRYDFKDRRDTLRETAPI